MAIESHTEAVAAVPVLDTGAGVALRRLFWRIHFWAGLVITPIVLFAALTGLLYVLTPELEAWQHAALDRVPRVDAQPVSLDAQVDAARSAFPGQAVRQVVPADAPGDTTQVLLHPPHEGHAGHAGHDHGLPSGRIVYVDPGRGTVVGSLHEMQRVKTWAKRLHSSALQGNDWRWPMELGASWMLVMVLTGIAMWWPQLRARGWAVLVPRAGQGGRVAWRDLHTSVGLLAALVLVVLLVTGLTWSRQAGDNFRALQKALAQEAPRVPRELRSRAGTEPVLGWQAAWEHARANAPDIRLLLVAPSDERGVWRAENFDRDQPTRRFSLALDAHSGEVLFSSGWSSMPVLAQATAVGIPFHRGEFGLWNRALLVLAGLAAVFMVISGWVMWWKRRPRGRVGVPRLTAQQARAVPWWLWPAGVAMAWALPVFGWSVLLFGTLELLGWGLRRWQRPQAAPLADRWMR